MSAVLDASAILAWIQNEDGAEHVHGVLNGAWMSTVNASEAAQKLVQHGADGAGALASLVELGVVITPFTSEDAVVAAEMWPHTRDHGLSLGDRACLALARRASLPALTSDQAWKSVDVDGIDIELIR
jgi:ribonuclease VapC